MFGPDIRCLVVVGAQWGDEGKGKIVDVLAEAADVVVRYQGGANAGHTVHTGAASFILHQIPAGILHPGTRCVIGNGVVLDPHTLLDEIDTLRERGVSVEGRLFVSNRAHLVLPYHKLLDQVREREEKIGTTGRGIGPAYEAKVARRGLRVADLANLAKAKATVVKHVAWANACCALLGSELRASEAEHEALLERVAGLLAPYVADSGRIVYDAVTGGRSVLLEGAQGALLDVDHGTYPFVTSSNTTAGGAAVGAGIGPTAIDAVLGVVKAYTTRVGNGPLPSEAQGDLGSHLRALGDEFGATTGRPRRCGWFDAVVARYAARINGVTHLAVTKLDVLDTLDEIPVAVGYELDGEPCDDLPVDVEAAGRVRPIYECLPGWRARTSATRRLADLPAAARAYLDRLEHLVGIPVRLVSVGAQRAQLIEAG